MLLFPAAPDACPICNIKHEPNKPHDATSMYYLYRFYGIRGRWPTWADAVAHCSQEMREGWEQALREHGAWTETVDGEPIADPPSESFHQAIGDLTSRGFGPES